MAPTMTSQSGFFHSIRTTTNASTVSIASVPVTAMPYAAARFDDVRKPITSANTATNRSQFTAGT